MPSLPLTGRVAERSEAGWEVWIRLNANRLALFDCQTSPPVRRFAACTLPMKGRDAVVQAAAAASAKLRPAARLRPPM
jgi:hypothetical protein